jgi:hypothetical protein
VTVEFLRLRRFPSEQACDAEMIRCLLLVRPGVAFSAGELARETGLAPLRVAQGLEVLETGGRVCSTLLHATRFYWYRGGSAVDPPEARARRVALARRHA